MLINDSQVKKFNESLQKTDDSLKKAVFMHNRPHARHNAVQILWMWDWGGGG